METNEHHEFWEARQWRKYRLSAQIRNHELSKSIMAVPIHNELHSYTPPMLPPTAEIGRLVLSHLNQLPMRYTSLDAAKSIYNELHEEAPEVSEHIGRQIPFLLLSAKALKQRRI